METELLAPEFLRVVASGVIESRKLAVNECGFAGGAAGVTHGGQQVLAVFFDDHSRIDEGEDAVVFFAWLGAAQVAELAGEDFDLGGRNPDIFAGFLGFLVLMLRSAFTSRVFWVKRSFSIFAAILERCSSIAPLMRRS